MKQVETKHIDEDIAFDYNEESKIAGIEVLDASRRIALIRKKDFTVSERGRGEVRKGAKVIVVGFRKVEVFKSKAGRQT